MSFDSSMLALLLMTRRPRGYTARRLRQAALHAGARLLAVDPDRLSLWVGTGAAELRVLGRRLVDVDAAHLRPGGPNGAHALALLRQLELRGVATLNSARALGALRPRLGLLVELEGAGLPVVAAATMTRTQELRGATGRVGGLPLVLRSEILATSEAVMVAGTLSSARAAAEMLLQRGGPVHVERHFADTVRIVVIAGRVAAAVRTRGGQLSGSLPTREEVRLATGAVRVLGLDVAGVDLANGAKGPLLAGITAAPALEGPETLCNVELAPRIVQAWQARLASGVGGGRLRK